MNSTRALRRGFTLVELLVVIAIIGILVALLLPAIQAAREAARRADCLNRIKQIAIACQNHHDTKKHFPASVLIIDTGKGTPANPLLTYWGYLVQILPYIEQQTVADRIDMKVFWQDDPNNAFLLSTEMPPMRCPSHADLDATFIEPPGSAAVEELPTNLRTHYMAVMGAKADCPTLVSSPWPLNTYTMSLSKNGKVLGKDDGCDASGGSATNGVMYVYGGGGKFTSSRVKMKDVTDGSTHTFLVGEISWNCGPQRIWAVGSSTSQTANNPYVYNYSAKNVGMWALNQAYRNEKGQPPPPIPYANNDMSFGSLHPGGTHFAMCDGSVQFIREEITLAQLRAMASRKSDEMADYAY